MKRNLLTYPLEQELLFQDNELPLFIQCEGRVLAIAPEIK